MLPEATGAVFKAGIIRCQVQACSSPCEGSNAKARGRKGQRADGRRAAKLLAALTLRLLLIAVAMVLGKRPVEAEWRAFGDLSLATRGRRSTQRRNIH